MSQLQIKPEDILKQYPAKSKHQKQGFLQELKLYVQSLGYSAVVDSERFGIRNLVVGNVQQSKFILTCGSSLSGLSAWLEILRTVPQNQRHKVCFVFLGGFFGGYFFCRKYKLETDQVLLIHLSHVGEGNHLRMYPSKLLKKNRMRLTSLYRACGYFGTRDLLVEEKKIPFFLKYFSFFPYAVTLRALYDRKKGLGYNPKTKDTALDNTNVNILRAALTTFICCDEVN